MLSLAGTYLNYPTRAQCDWVAANISERDMCPWTLRAWPGKNLTHLSWPTGFQPAEPVRLNWFRWPVGAMRWASGHFLASSTQVGAVRTAAFGSDGRACNLVTLRFDTPGNPAAEAVETQVYVLPPTPLGRIDPPAGVDFVEGLYLLTVVSKRYYWWDISTPEFNIGDATTWEDLYAACAARLGIAIAVDPIPAAYLRPSRRLDLKFEVLPAVLDTIAFNTGMRIIENLDGSVRAISATSSRTILETNIANAQRTRRAGGVRFADPL